MIKRMFIDQPSTLQPLHNLNGKKVLAVKRKGEDVYTVYFTEGPVISMMCPKICLSDGWP